MANILPRPDYSGVETVSKPVVGGREEGREGNLGENFHILVMHSPFSERRGSRCIKSRRAMT